MSQDNSRDEYKRKKRLLQEWKDREHMDVRRRILTRLVTGVVGLTRVADVASEALSEGMDHLSERAE